MEFVELKKLLKDHVANMVEDQSTLFITNVDPHKLWDTYLESFPEGTNEIFRERREYDCSCCRHFIRSFGRVVAIKDNKVTSIWDFRTNDTTFQPVLNALSSLVKNFSIKDIFVTKEHLFGTDCNFEQFDDGSVHTWEHFHVDLPKRFVSRSHKSEASLMGEYRDIKNVFKRSLDEISKDAIKTVLELINQKSLYKGDEWKKVLMQFLELHHEYHKLQEEEKDNYCWSKSIKIGGVIGKIRNHSIGVLLNDITQYVDLNEAVSKYEAIVAPTNYKRPKAIFTKKMVEQAQQTINEMGLFDSLGRRHATIDDITINNIIFANRDATKKIKGDVFTELSQEAYINPKKFDKVEEIPVELFIKNILPTTTNVEIFLENSHAFNFVSVITSKVKDSKTLFKWANGFSWAYNGNITDSMKERVKKAGGKVDGVLRFSLQWNENADNLNDFDAHCIEPNGNHIWFENKGQHHPSTGMLDVDIIDPLRTQIAIENIIWTNLKQMQEGTYQVYVYNYTHRGGRSGFTAEIEYDGHIYSYEYNKNIRVKEKVVVAIFKFSKKHGIQFIESLPSSASSKTIWGLQTNQFHPVSFCMFSPNYWDNQKEIGHKHYFFILQGCKNEDKPNGFFNEFLQEDLIQHKRVFEALGSKMQVEQSDNQLSGLGFSSTQRNSLICKISGHFTRTIKVIF